MGVTKIYNPQVVAKSFMPPGSNIHIVDTVKRASIPLTAAQLIAMGTTPVTLIAAPPTGQVIVPDQMILEVNRTTTAFTGGGTIQFQYHTATTVLHASTLPASLLTTAGAAQTASVLFGNNGLVLAAADGIDITNNGGAFAAGTGTAIVHIIYRILSL